MKPSMLSSSLSCFIFFSNSVSEVVLGILIKVDSNPTSSQALTLLPTYVKLAPSFPTIIAARCGTFSLLAFILLTSAVISALMSLEIFFPSNNSIFVVLLFIKKDAINRVSILSHSTHHLHQVLRTTALHHLHHFAHLVELLHQLVYFFYFSSGTFGDSRLSFHIDYRRFGSFLRCH